MIRNEKESSRIYRSVKICRDRPSDSFSASRAMISGSLDVRPFLIVHVTCVRVLIIHESAYTSSVQSGVEAGGSRIATRPLSSDRGLQEETVLWDLELEFKNVQHEYVSNL